MLDPRIFDGLVPWQREEVAKLADGKPRLLWADAGTGKTPVLVRWLRQRRLGGCHRRNLYACPSGLVRQVEREILRWWPGCRVQRITKSNDKINATADIVLVGYGLLQRRNPGSLVDRLAEIAWGGVALDESHALKNPDAKRTQHILLGDKAVVHRAQQVVFSSGTPLVGTALDLWATIQRLQIEALAETISGRRLAITYQTFNARFVQWQQKDFGGHSAWVAVGSKNLEELRGAMAPRMRRARLEDVAADLPTLRVAPLPLDCGAIPELPADLAREIRRLMADRADGDEEAGFELMDLLNREKVALASWRRMLGASKAQAVADHLVARLEGTREPALAYVHHVSVGDTILNALRGAGIRCAAIRGDVSPAERDARVQAFDRGDLQVLVLQHESGGTGLNLQKAHYGVICELPWTDAAFKQSVARMHRRGQRMPVLVETAFVPGSLDEIVADIIARKAADAAVFNVTEAAE